MSFEMDMPEDLGPQGNFLREAGAYHCVVTNVAEGAGPKGNPIDGFTVGLDVLTGTAGGQEGKVFNLTLFGTKLNGTEEGNRMARAKQAAFVVACNLVGLDQLGKRVYADLQKAVNQQIVVKLVPDERSTEGYLQLHYADIWHVDDPRCGSVPKKAEAIAMIPKQFRHVAADFDALKKKRDSNGGSSGSTTQTAKPKPPQQPPSAGKVSFDDL